MSNLPRATLLHHLSAPDEPRDWRMALDLVVRVVLALTFAVSAGFYLRNAFALFGRAAEIEGGAARFSHAASVLAIGLYIMMIACLYVVRLRPVNRFAGIVPCAAAILGGFMLSGLLLLSPRDDLPASARIAACCLVIVGNILSIFILTRLGRSFSILPESRKLVTSGPYRVVRHPLYLAEMIVTLGAMINFLSPLAVAIVGAQFGMQLIRMHYEEKVLRECFPEYASYARRTARLIPGVY